MSQKTKIIISIILSIVIIAVGIIVVATGNNKGEKESKELLNAIKYIQEENYIEANKEIQNSSQKEIDIIKTITLYKFMKEIDKSTEINEKIGDEAENITDYLTYTFLYSKDEKYQRNIDKIYAEEYGKLYEVKTKIPREIIYEDAQKYYDLYMEYIALDDGVFKNYEYNIRNNKDSLVSKFNQISDKLKELQKELDIVVGKYPETNIPEEYRVLLDLK